MPQVKLAELIALREKSFGIERLKLNKQIIEVLNQIEQIKRDELLNFVQEVVQSEENQNVSVKLNEVGEREAEKLKLHTGLDLYGYTHEIDNYGVKHVLKQHGNPQKETTRGQVAITPEDFTLILDIVQNYDKVEYAGQTKIGRDTIKYMKQYDDVVFYIEEVRDGKKGKKLMMQTMYKRKGSVSHTSETFSD